MNRLLTLALTAAVSFASFARADVELLNVSYDASRELYADFNEKFAAHYKAETGETVTINQSHSGSGKQARAVIDGLEADVVTLALALDIQGISEQGKLLPGDWITKLPNNSSPYTSTIVILVRKGNPKGIKDWEDLAKPGIGICAPNPKTGGGARWNYLAAWGGVLKHQLGDLKKLHDPAAADEVAKAQTKAQEVVGQIYRNMVSLDTGARGSLTNFAQRGQGDALIAWENEAYLAAKELGPDQFDIVVPSVSILAEPSVAVVDKNVDKKGTRKEAEAYLKYLYSDEGQEIIAKHHYRPRNEAIAKKYPLPAVELFTIDDVFGGWKKAQETHFVDGAIFDQELAKK